MPDALTAASPSGLAAPSSVGLLPRLVRALGTRHVRTRLRGDLDGVRVAGLDRIREASRAGPLLLAANHVSWWDSLLLVALTDALGVEGRFVMDADRLRDYPFFAAFGAIALDRSSALAARHGLREAAAWPDRPGRVLWFFPQGEQRPTTARPLDLQPGITWLARRSGARVAPVAFDYAFREAPEPAAWAWLGHPLPDGAERDDLAAALEAGLDRIAEDALRSEPSFETLFHPRPRREPAARLLAWLWRLLV